MWLVYTFLGLLILLAIVLALITWLDDGDSEDPDGLQ